MPTRTELVISIGDVICCLPPGKAFKRKRYNSFDANVGNEENLAPGHIDPSKIADMRQTDKLGPCGEPDVLTVRAKRVPANTCEGDEEVSFRKDVFEEEPHENASDKSKRKTTSEKFLEDNANYFQLEVLSAKTRSKKISENKADSDNEQGGFHHSFLDFLKSKDVDKKPGGRTRHRSDESEVGGGRDQTESRGRSRSSSSHCGRSVSSGRSLSSRARSRSGGRRARIGRRLLHDSSDLSPGTTSDASSQQGGRQKAKRETSASESEVEARPRRSKAVMNMRELSLSGSEAESVSSTPAPRRVGRRGQVAVSEPSSEIESDDEKDDKMDNSPRKGRRSELDKLLEAVDTSFHFETAAAERKRLSDTNMKPLEIDCSDTGSEASCNVGNKRKFSEEEKNDESTGKKCKGSNNLLKTASPSSGLKIEATSEDESDREGCSTWEGWESLNSQLESITHSPVVVDQLHFSFEKEPKREGWYSTYQRQDKGDEVVFYPASTTAPFFLPYEMNYASFLPVKGGRDNGRKGDTDVSRPESKASSPARQIMPTSSKKGRRKISECESTDSEDTRKGRGKAGRFVKASAEKPVPDKLGSKANLLLEPNCRQSPRCHASTKSIQQGGALPGELDDLAEAYLMQDERDLHFPHLASFLHLEDNSNDSHSSGSCKSRSRTETTTELCQLATNIDRIMTEGAVLPVMDTEEPTKVPPTRSRVSSDQLLSPKKPKKRKKLPSTDDSVSPLDQLVADDVDPVLLDCLEDELPTVPLILSTADTLELVSTYSACTSMSTCNSRWLRPSKRSIVDTALSNSGSSSGGEDGKTDHSMSSLQKKVPSPSKPKRIIIYKEDLPGFSIDSDMETEKLPVSKRVLAKAKADIKTEAKPTDVKSSRELKKDVEEPSRVNSDEEDSVSVESFSSISPSSKKKRKANRTGFPSPKKKKKVESPPPTPPKSCENQNKSPPSKTKIAPKVESEAKTKTKQITEDSSVKKKVSKQVKMDLFITRKSIKRTSSSNSSNSAAGSRRSAALKAKNYSEIESDTESLFEVGGATSSSPSPAPSLQKPGKVGRKK